MLLGTTGVWIACDDFPQLASSVRTGGYEPTIGSRCPPASVRALDPSVNGIKNRVAPVSWIRVLPHFFLFVPCRGSSRREASCFFASQPHEFISTGSSCLISPPLSRSRRSHCRLRRSLIWRQHVEHGAVFKNYSRGLRSNWTALVWMLERLSPLPSKILSPCWRPQLIQ